jgi:hypothetical protein
MKIWMNTRNPNKSCHFYHDHGHDIDKCYSLKKYRKIDHMGSPLIVYKEGSVIRTKKGKVFHDALLQIK